MRVLIWHGWLLEGSGSNVGVARIAEVLRTAGHDVLVLCQEPNAERYDWIDAWGEVGRDGPVSLREAAKASPSRGRCTLLRPRIGSLLPVFVLDDYEGFEVRRFVDLADDDLASYLDRNAEALAAAVDWHGSEAVIAGHAVPGPAIAKRALGPRRYAAKIHGSDLEYAVKPQARYLGLAAEGLENATVVAGASADVITRCRELVPGIEPERLTVIPPGVSVSDFRLRERRGAFAELVERLRRDPDLARGRPGTHDEAVARAVSDRDGAALDDLAAAYDQEIPDPDAADRLEALGQDPTPIVGYFGKLIPQKGVELVLAGCHATSVDVVPLVVGFGTYREWLAALDLALGSGDPDGIDWVLTAGGSSLGPDGISRPVPSGRRAVFTGRLDHRYAPLALATMEILIVPSILDEAFGMVVVEGAASGALPLVARHSGLAEVASALEGAVDGPGLFSFQPGPGAVGRVAAGIDRLLSIPAATRGDLRRRLSAFVGRELSWERTAERLLDAATDPGVGRTLRT